MLSCIVLYALFYPGLCSIVSWSVLGYVVIYALFPDLCSVKFWSMLSCIVVYAHLYPDLCSVASWSMLCFILAFAHLYPGLCSVVLWYMLCFILVYTQLHSGLLQLSLAFIAKKRSWNECCPLISRFLLLRKIIWNKNVSNLIQTVRQWKHEQCAGSFLLHIHCRS